MQTRVPVVHIPDADLAEQQTLLGADGGEPAGERGGGAVIQVCIEAREGEEEGESFLAEGAAGAGQGVLDVGVCQAGGVDGVEVEEVGVDEVAELAGE